MKTCIGYDGKCWHPDGPEMQLDEFTVWSGKHKHQCKVCIAHRARQYNIKHSEHLKEKKKEWYETNREEEINKSKRRYYKNHEHNKQVSREYHQNDPEGSIRRDLMNHCRRNAIRKKLDIDIDYEWIDGQIEILDNKCTKTGLPFVWKRHYPFGPSIDRIDSAKGYTQDNCQIVCKMYNFAKNKWSDADVLDMAKALLKESKNHK
tara:strand:- start:214 stop:828 length:615 start_codon:yes stop_codon:yes gene_type:complete